MFYPAASITRTKGVSEVLKGSRRHGDDCGYRRRHVVSSLLEELEHVASKWRHGSMSTRQGGGLMILSVEIALYWNVAEQR